MTDAQACVWTLCLAALVLCALTGPLVAVLTPLPPRPPFTSWPPPSPRPSSAPTWPSPPCSSPPSCASCGPARPTIGSPLGKRWDVPRVARHGPLSWFHRPRSMGPGGTIRGPTLGPHPPCRGPTEAISVGPTVVLGPKPWSPRGPSFHTGNWACGTTVVPALYLGVGTTGGPGTTALWDHGWSQHHGAEGRPRAQRRGTG
jgi:hypothetical protein